jgi:hypothetical protein
MLMLSKCALSVADLKAAIVDNVDVLASLNGRVGTSGRLNVDRALRSCASAATTAPVAPGGLVAR